MEKLKKDKKKLEEHWILRLGALVIDYLVDCICNGAVTIHLHHFSHNKFLI